MWEKDETEDESDVNDASSSDSGQIDDCRIEKSIGRRTDTVGDRFDFEAIFRTSEQKNRMATRFHAF